MFAEVEIAAALADQGVPVFPAFPGGEGQEFRLPKGWQNTVPDGRAVREAAKRGAIGFGAVCGVKFDVIDVDPRHGGDESLEKMRDLGVLPPLLGQTETPGGGWHLFVAPSGLRRSKPLPGIDYQAGTADGEGRGFVWLPGTRRPKYEGRGYTWVEIPEIGQEAAPAEGWLGWLRDVTRQPSRGRVAASERPVRPVVQSDGRTYLGRVLEAQCGEVAAAVEGSRNDTLFRAALKVSSVVAGVGVSGDAERSALVRAGIGVGLAPSEAAATVRRGFQIGGQNPFVPESQKEGDLSAGRLQVRVTPPTPSPAPSQGAAAAAAGRLSDLERAEILIAQQGVLLRYVTDRDVWLAWSGRWWREQLESEVRALIMARAGSLSLSSSRELSSLVSMLKSLPGLQVRASELDQNPLLLACGNGTLDLGAEGGPRLRESDPADLLSRGTVVEFRPGAVSADFDRLLEGMFGDGGDGRLRYVQQWAGYSLTGLSSWQQLLVLHGCGENGKSTFVEALSRCVGGYSTDLPPSALTRRAWDDGSTTRPEIASLNGARLVAVSEFSESAPLAESMVKALTSGVERIQASRKYENPVSFVPRCKLWIATNHVPRVSGTDRGIWRRLAVVETSQFAGVRDMGLKDRVMRELEAVLWWAVCGWKDVCVNGRVVPESVEGAVSRLRSDSDRVARFLEESVVVDEGGFCAQIVLYEAYREWVVRRGGVPLDAQLFGSRLEDLGWVPVSRSWQGVRRPAWKDVRLVG